MNYNKEYQKFRENIRTIVSEEVNKILIEKNLYVTHSGTIIQVNEVEDSFQQICGVDIVYAKINNLMNKTGQKLSIGDSVIIFEKMGSHLANCFIAYKNQA